MEAAKRVFAGEFNRSTLLLEGAGTPPRVVTPGGLACSRLYIAGALTEVKGRRGGVMHARIADPSGGFSLEVGWQQTEIAEVLETAPVPGFIAVTASVHLFQKGSKSSLRVRPETLWTADRVTRDTWVLQTAESSLERLEDLLAALRGGNAPPDLQAAIDHYAITEKNLQELGEMVVHALLSVRSAEDEPQALHPGTRETLLALLADTTAPSPMPIDLLIARARERGCSPEDVSGVIEELLAEGECYMPRRGLIKLA